MNLTAIILTRNEARHIQDCIASLQWADRVIVFDSGSTDNTRQLAADAGADVLENAFINYPQQRNDALKVAESDWVLFVDADERVSPELAAEVQQVLENPQHAGYWIPRHNFIFGKLTQHTGWYPDYQMRLLKRNVARYDPERQVHELVMLPEGDTGGHLQTPLIHYNYDSVAQFHEKQRRYVQYDAKILYEEGIKPKIYTPFTQPIRHFKWRFFDLQGYKDGLHGLHLSLLMAWYELRKYWILRGMWS
jgi:glycosyltransferase involved in cell wall biosynthesis